MSTPHFLITFQSGQEPLAHQTAYYAELAHGKITKQMDYEPVDKTQLVLVESSDDANGFATHYFGYNKEHFWLVYGRPNSTLRSRIETWLYTLAIHEHTHTVHIDMASSLPGFIRGLFGKMGRPQATPIPYVLWPDLTSPNSDLPVYLVEGFASYMETVNTEGGRLRDPLWEMMMRADFVNQEIMTRDQASGRYTYARFTGDAPYYMYGAYLCDYIARTYGQERLFEIMHENSQGSSLSINGTFIRVLGKSLPEVWDEFIAQAQKIYAKQEDEIRSQGLTEMKKITNIGEYAASPIFSPDGSEIAYAQGGRHQVPSIRLMRMDGAFNHTVVTTDLVFTGEEFSWSPDGTKLIYSRSDYVGERTVDDLYLFDLSAGQERRLTYGLRANGPSWSPDGQMIVFVAKTGPLQTSLMTMNADGTDPRELLAGKGEMQFSSPRFSPDGKQIAVAALTFGGFEDIYLLKADGSDFHTLTQDRAKDFAPQWSPDGIYILFNSDRSGVNNIYAYRHSDGRLLQVTNVLFGAFSPTMSPDGKTIAFVTYDTPGYDIQTVAVDPAAWKAVTLHRETLPRPPDYVQLTKDYEIHHYSALGTLLPHLWQPVLSTAAWGALTYSEDLLGRTNYNVVGTYGLQGGTSFEFAATHSFSESPVTGSGPQVPTLSLRLTPQSLTGSTTWPLQQSLNSSQLLSISATYGMLGVIPTMQGPLVLQGLGVEVGWTLNLTGGRDALRSFYSLGLAGTTQVTDIGTLYGMSAEARAVWLLLADYRIEATVDMQPLDLAARGNINLTLPLLHIEKQLGTWPIYFDRVTVEGFVGGRMTPLGVESYYYGMSVGFPTYLWYNFQIQPSVGIVIDSSGQWSPFFDVGL